MSRTRSTLAWLFPAAAIIGSCGWLGLIEPTDARYAEIGREMLASRDWLIPHLNGIPHFHKPPLAYWLTAGGIYALGANEWGARLGLALTAAFVLWATARIARLTSAGASATGTMMRGDAILAPLFLGSMLLFFTVSHQLAADMFLTASVAGFYAAVFEWRARRSIWPFIALAVGFMAKGPVVFATTILPVLVAALWAWDAGLVKWLGNWRGWLVFLLLGLPWYVWVVLMNPGLHTFFLKDQLWDRYVTTVHHRSGPPYYFLVVILAGALPWTWAALVGWWRAVRARGERNQADAMLVAWALIPLIFFSFSGSKLPAYVLPIFPALAILASRWPAPLRGTRWARLGILMIVLLLAVLAVATPFEAQFGSSRPLAQALAKSKRRGDVIVEYGKFNAGFPFYLRQTVPLLEVPRDLTFTDEDAREGVIITRGDLVSMIDTRGSAWIVGKQDAIEALAAERGLSAKVVSGSKDHSLALLERAEAP